MAKKYTAIQILGRVALISYLFAAYTLFFWLEKPVLRPLMLENGYFELLAAFAFLAASIMFFLSYRSTASGNDFGVLRTKRNVFMLLLALVFFVGAGEELSWGQHFFGFDTPGSVLEGNLQGELNLHNLPILDIRNDDRSLKTGFRSLLTMGKMFSLFWFGFCVLVPILAALSTRVKSILERINLPIVPLWLGLLFVANYVTSKIVAGMTGGTGHFVIEVKESNFALLFLVIGVIFYARTREPNHALDKQRRAQRHWSDLPANEEWSDLPPNDVGVGSNSEHISRI